MTLKRIRPEIQAVPVTVPNFNRKDLISEISTYDEESTKHGPDHHNYSWFIMLQNLAKNIFKD